MFRLSKVLQKLRPRHVAFTPPPLSRRPGKFKCKLCEHEWTSENVWVTKTTQRCYQGESCDECGTTNKPYYIGFWEKSIFNTVDTPHAVKPGAASTSRHGRKLRHVRYDRHMQFKRR